MREICSGVYVGKNLDTGKVYVGSALNVHSRIRSHQRNLANGRHDNRHLQFAWNKYGSDRFVWRVLELCPVDERLLREQEWIDKLRSSQPRSGYNIMHTVRGPCPSPRRSELSAKMWRDPKFKARTRARIKKAWNRPEHKAWLSKTLKTRWEDPEYRARQSAMMKAQWEDPAYRRDVQKKQRAKWRSRKFRSKMSAARRETGKSAAYKRKQSKGSLVMWKDPVFRAMMSERHRLSWRRPGTRKARLVGQARGRARRAKKLAVR